MVSKTILLLAIIPAVILAAGIGGYVYYEGTKISDVLQNVEVIDARIDYMDPVGTPVMKRLDLLLVVDVRNNADETAYIKAIKINVYVDGVYAGSTEATDIDIAGKGIETVSTLLHVENKEAIKMILQALTNNETINVIVNGTIVTPIKLLDLAEVHETYRDFGISFSQKLPWPLDEEYLSIVNIGFEPQETIVDRPVDIHVGLFSVAQREVKVDVYVKKDLVSQPDQVVYEYSTTIPLKGYGVIDFSWTPTETSSDTLRGYYLEVYINGEKYYTMQDSYPPRLKVLSRASIVKVVDAYWIVNGERNYTARVGDTVEGVVVLRSTEEITATIKIVIKKDLVLRPDQVVEEQSYSMTLKPYENATVSITFTPTEASSTLFKGYFIEVYVDGEKVYSMPPEYPPRLRVEG